MKWIEKLLKRDQKRRVARWGESDVTEEEVRRIAQAALRDSDVKRCVAWIARDIRSTAIREAAAAKPADGGYPFALARMAGMLAALNMMEDLWENVCNGELAERMKAEREDAEKGERVESRRE